LGAPSRRDIELNEAKWWSRWARLSWVNSGCYLLASEEFAEPFFNRAGVLSCGGTARAASWAEKELGKRGLRSTVLTFESCVAGTRALLAGGYRVADTMAVLASKGTIAKTTDSRIRVQTSRSPGPWVRAYLRAFYGSEELAESVLHIATRLSKARETTLLEARVQGEVAGSLALFKTKGLAGVYCVGTVPEFRGRGVATQLLARAKEIATEEGRVMILQTLASDGAGRFYRERGFEHLYSKMILEKES
jgi:GNAT superfamily N-acetyltransferase